MDKNKLLTSDGRELYPVIGWMQDDMSKDDVKFHMLLWDTHEKTKIIK
jgi:hypothetical protein